MVSSVLKHLVLFYVEKMITRYLILRNNCHASVLFYPVLSPFLVCSFPFCLFCLCLVSSLVSALALSSHQWLHLCLVCCPALSLSPPHVPSLSWCVFIAPLFQSSFVWSCVYFMSAHDCVFVCCKFVVGLWCWPLQSFWKH